MDGRTDMTETEDNRPAGRELTGRKVLMIFIAVFGVISLVNGSIAMGIILLIAAAVVGPGGYSYVGR